MPELRWILLILGVLLIAAIWVRDRLGRGGATPRASARTQGPVARPDAHAAEMIEPRRTDEFTLPEIRTVDRHSELPIIEVPLDAPDDVAAKVLMHFEEATPLPVPPAPPPLVVDWPPESERHIVALRLVPKPGERFVGRNLRQALVGEGFQFGRYDIFHLPADDGRALVSAASLTNPGSFVLGQIELQHFAGVSLFTVLPGPLPSLVAFEQLLGAGRRLAARLGGELRDGRNQPLSDSRIAELRAACAQQRDSARHAAAQVATG
jgi:FtsZ-interacting cell division protein ZipA